MVPVMRCHVSVKMTPTVGRVHGIIIVARVVDLMRAHATQILVTDVL